MWKTREKHCKASMNLAHLWLVNDLTCSEVIRYQGPNQEPSKCRPAHDISNDLEKILGCHGFKGLFLNRGNTGYKCDCSAKSPNVSKLHFWNSSRGPYIRLELCMCLWQLLLRPTRLPRKTPTAPSPTIQCVFLSTRTYPPMKKTYMGTENMCIDRKAWAHWADNGQEHKSVKK